MFFHSRLTVLSIIVLFVFYSSCTKKERSSSSSQGVEKDPSFAYANSFREVNLNSSEFLGDFVLNIEVIPYPTDVTTDSFEFYMCLEDGSDQCQPSRDAPQFVDGLYERDGYDYPLAPEGENEVFVRACNNSLEKRICGVWQIFSYTQPASLDQETSELVDASYIAGSTLDDMITAIEDISGVSFEEDEDPTASILNELLADVSDANETADTNSTGISEETVSDSNSASNETADTNSTGISEETVFDSNSASNETAETDDDREISEETVFDSNSASNETAETDDDSEISEETVSDSNSASNETADTDDDSVISEETVSDSNSDSNETADTDDDSEISEETVSDSNETAETDGFNFDPTFEEEEIAIIVGVSAVTIVAISLIVVYA